MKDKEKIYNIIKDVLELLKFDAEVEIVEKEEITNVTFVINSDEFSQFLIGHHGANLQALEYLIHGIARAKKLETRFTIDVNDYKKNKENSLIREAKDVVRDVLKNKRPVILKPMNAYERRLIHTALKEEEKITTESIGDGRIKKVVIKLITEV